MVEELLVNKDNIELCRQTLLNNIKILIDSYIASSRIEMSILNMNAIFNILLAKNVIESLDNDDLLDLVKETNNDIYNVMNLKSLYSIPENNKRPN